MQKYKCTKTVEAMCIASIEVLDDDHFIIKPWLTTHGKAIKVTNEWMAKHKPQVDWYIVRYSDGYVSASPKEAFENGYVEVSKCEE